MNIEIDSNGEFVNKSHKTGLSGLLAKGLAGTAILATLIGGPLYKINHDEREELKSAYKNLNQAHIIYATDPDRKLGREKAIALLEKVHFYVSAREHEFARSHRDEAPLFVSKDEVMRLKKQADGWNLYFKGKSPVKPLGLIRSTEDRGYK